jgi:hypothetical protein
MTLLFKQSRETTKETLSVKLEDDQGNNAENSGRMCQLARQFVEKSLVERLFPRTRFSYRAASRGPKWVK